MNKERLLNAVKALRESPKPARFTMINYGNCGSPGCVLGHYAYRTDLQDEFTFRENRVWPRGEYMAYLIYDGGLVQEHFEISGWEAECLFGPTGCNGAKTPEEAAIYLESFVSSRGAELRDIGFGVTFTVGNEFKGDSE